MARARGRIDRRLAGNLNRWPVAWHPTENWFRTRVVHDGAETEARLYKVELPELFPKREAGRRIHEFMEHLETTRF